MTDVGASDRFATYEAEVLGRFREFRREPGTSSRNASIDAIDRYVDAMRGADYPPERVVIAIKALCRTGLSLTPSLSRETLREVDAITAEFVIAAIRRLFYPTLSQNSDSDHRLSP